MWLGAPAVAPAGWASYRLVGRLRNGSTLARARDDATRVVRETLEYRADMYGSFAGEGEILLQAFRGAPTGRRPASSTRRPDSCGNTR